MECLVAILLIGLTVAMVTPPLLIATATRVQNRRAEQAMQLAQDEVDRVSTLVQQGLHESKRLPKFDTATNLQSVKLPSAVYGKLKTSRPDSSACPAGSYSGYARYTNPNEQIPVNAALPVDVDGDCVPEFFVQIFRSEGTFTSTEAQKTDATTRRPAKFDLGIRVYSALAEKNLKAGSLKDPQPAQLLMTQGQGKQATNPLVVVYKPFAWSEEADALCTSVSEAVAKTITACSSPSP